MMQNKFILFSEKQRSLRGQEILTAKINGGYISRDQRDRLNLTQSELLEIERSVPRLKGGFGVLALVGIMLGQYVAGHLLDEFVANPLRKLIEGDRPSALQLIQRQLNQMEENADERARLIIAAIHQNFAHHEIMFANAFKLVLSGMSSFHTDLLNQIDWRAARSEVNFHINRIFGVMDSLVAIELIYNDREVFRNHLQRGFHDSAVDLQVIFRPENIEQLLLATSKRNLYLVELQKRELVAILQASLAIELAYIQEFGRAYNVNALNEKYTRLAAVLKDCIDRIYGAGYMRSWPQFTVKHFLERQKKEHLIMLDHDFSKWSLSNSPKYQYEFELLPRDSQISAVYRENVIYLQKKDDLVYYSVGSHNMRKKTHFKAPKPFSLDTLRPFFDPILQLATDNEDILSFEHRVGLAEDTHFFVDKRQELIYPIPSQEERRINYCNFVDQLARENKINIEQAQQMKNSYSSSDGKPSCVIA